MNQNIEYVIIWMTSSYYRESTPVVFFDDQVFMSSQPPYVKIPISKIYPQPKCLSGRKIIVAYQNPDRKQFIIYENTLVDVDGTLGLLIKK